MSIATLINGAFETLTQRAPANVVDSGPDVSNAPPDTRRLIRNRQYCHVISTQANVQFDELSLSCAHRMLEHEMALVPGGQVRLVCDTAVQNHQTLEIVSAPSEPISVSPIFLDRDCVTNEDYAKFVKSGGYENPHYWPESILANVLQFVDSTGLSGPKYWREGRPSREKMDHPVVGISWYEANAYATWCGKRLPTSEEWQRAGTWSKSGGNTGAELRYPWGNGFDPFNANTWACGAGRTFPVDAFSDGSTPSGVRQLIGNVWEWVDAQFQPFGQEGTSVLLDESMAEVRGGAFDTYFHSHATCQFRTGQPLLSRGNNVGFRCCISESEVAEISQSNTDLESQSIDEDEL